MFALSDATRLCSVQHAMRACAGNVRNTSVVSVHVQGGRRGGRGAASEHHGDASAGAYMQQHYGAAYDAGSMSPNSAAAAAAAYGYGGGRAGGRGGRLAAATAAAAAAAGYGAYGVDGSGGWGDGEDYRAAMAAGMAAAGVPGADMAGAVGAYEDPSAAYAQHMGAYAAAEDDGMNGMSYSRHLQQQLTGQQQQPSRRGARNAAAPTSPQPGSLHRGIPAGNGGVSPGGRSLGRLDAVAAVAAAELQATSSSGSHAEAAAEAGAVQDPAAAELMQQRRRPLQFPDAAAGAAGAVGADLAAEDIDHAAVAAVLTGADGPGDCADLDQAPAGPEEEIPTGPPVPGSKAYKHMQHQLELLALHAGLDPAAAAAAAAAAAEAAQLQQQQMDAAPEADVTDAAQYSQQQPHQHLQQLQEQQPATSHDTTGEGAGVRRSHRAKRRRRYSNDHVTEDYGSESDDQQQEQQYAAAEEETLDDGGFGAAEVLESLQGYCAPAVPQPSLSNGRGVPAAPGAARRGTASPTVSGGSLKRGLEPRSPYHKQAICTAAGLVAVGSDSGKGLSAVARALSGFGAQQSPEEIAAGVLAGHMSEPPPNINKQQQHQGVAAMMRSSSGGMHGTSSRGTLQQQHQQGGISQWGSATLDNSAAAGAKWQQQHHRLSNTDSATCLTTQGSGGGAPESYGVLPGAQPPACNGNRRVTVASTNGSRLQSTALAAAGSGDYAAMGDVLRRSSNDSTCMPPQQLSMAASYIANVLESAVCATVHKALPSVLAGFSQCVVKTLAAASTAMQQQQQQRPGSSDGQQQQLMMAAADELLKGLQAACQKAISTEAVAELMQNGSSIQALIAGGEQQPKQPPGAAVAALAAAADAANEMGHQELASAAMAAAQAGVVKPEVAAAAAAAAEVAVLLAAGAMQQQQQKSAGGDVEMAEAGEDLPAQRAASVGAAPAPPTEAQLESQQGLPAQQAQHHASAQPALKTVPAAAAAVLTSVPAASPALVSSEDCEGTGTGTNTEHAAETSPESDRGLAHAAVPPTAS